MALTKEQISGLKKQLHEQIKSIPIDQRKQAEEQIDNLSDNAIEEMLESQKSSVKIFRDIVEGKVPSKKVEENDFAVAVLDIKPISKGHTIIIPKDKISEIDKISETINNFISKVVEKLSKRLKANSIKIIPEKKFGEAVINIIPIYDKDLTLESSRLEVSEEELNKISEEIHKEEENKEEVSKVKEPLKKFPRRIP